MEIKNLDKSFGGLSAVLNFSILLDKKGLIGLIGPNGAGKTTTILMLTGMIEPTEGICLIDGIDVARNPLKAKEVIGYLPEDVGFYGNMTGKDNLDYFAKFYGIYPDKREERIDYLLDLVRLNGVTQTVGGYSRGMNQRLGLAQALLNDPKVVILDEPTANLDPEGVAQFRKIIRKISDEGKTILICSHILSEIKQVCRTLGILSQGKMVAQGTTEEVEEQLREQSNIPMKITIESIKPLPELSHPDILEIHKTENRAEISVNRDIRRELSSQLQEASNGIIEMHLEKPGLEQLFLKVYRRD